MKNLNKKIGVVALSGLIVLGGGLASSASAWDYLAKGPSGYESKWPKLADQVVKKEDYDYIVQAGQEYGDIGYDVLDYADKKSSRAERQKLEKRVKAYFDNKEDFFMHFGKVGLKGKIVYNIGGVYYLFNFK